jgi:hypothetical protein
VRSSIHWIVQELEELRRGVGVLIAYPMQGLIPHAVRLELLPVALPFLPQSRRNHHHHGTVRAPRGHDDRRSDGHGHKGLAHAHLVGQKDARLGL